MQGKGYTMEIITIKMPKNWHMEDIALKVQQQGYDWEDIEVKNVGHEPDYDILTVQIREY